MKKILILTILTLSSVVFIGCGDDSENTETNNNSFSLTYKFKQGQVFYVVLDWHQTSTGKDSTGKTNKADTTKMVTTFKYTVERVDEKGTADLSITYDHMRMGNFDSNDSTQRNTREGIMFASMMNYILKTKIDNKGKVLELSGGDNFYTFGQRDTLVDDNACLRDDLAQFFEILPTKDVKNGDTWESSHAINFGFPALFKNTFTFVGVEDSVATIEVSSVVSPNELGKTVFPGRYVLKQLFNGNRTVSIKFDLRKGLIQSSSYHDIYDGDVTGTSNNMPIKIKLNVNLHKNFTVTTN